VAIARGLVCDNDLVLADEPTGNLDEHNVELIANCFTEENRAGRTLVIVTHDRALLDISTRQIHLETGRLVRQT
jgi:putative ABC transport system ATP-binding protein